MVPFLLYFLTYAVLDLLKGAASIFGITCFLTIYLAGLENMKGLCRILCGVSADKWCKFSKVEGEKKK